MDIIIDFMQTQDKIDVAELGFTDIEYGEGHDSVLGFEFVGGNTRIEDAESDFAIELVGEYNLVNSDFIFS